MQLRRFAERILDTAELDAKLASPELPLEDTLPGAARRVARPARPPELCFAARRAAPAMPKPATFRRPQRRAVAHHLMANHELQALEVMACVLVAFPDAPPEFRRGLVHVMTDEQRHTRMHVERARSLGLTFGGLPVNGYIWQKAQEFTSVLDYLAGLPLTFEGRNLDHTLELAEHFQAAGDDAGAAVLRAIHHDEIEHVRFGIEWLRRLKPPELSDWEVFESHLHWPLNPAKARGGTFLREPRLEAGLSADFVDRLAAIDRDGP